MLLWFLDSVLVLFWFCLIWFLDSVLVLLWFLDSALVPEFYYGLEVFYFENLHSHDLLSAGSAAWKLTWASLSL